MGPVVAGPRVRTPPYPACFLILFHFRRLFPISPNIRSDGVFRLGRAAGTWSGHCRGIPISVSLTALNSPRTPDATDCDHRASRPLAIRAPRDPGEPESTAGEPPSATRCNFAIDISRCFVSGLRHDPFRTKLGHTAHIARLGRLANSISRRRAFNRACSPIHRRPAARCDIYGTVGLDSIGPSPIWCGSQVQPLPFVLTVANPSAVRSAAPILRGRSGTGSDHVAQINRDQIRINRSNLPTTHRALCIGCLHQRHRLAPGVHHPIPYSRRIRRFHPSNSMTL